MTKTFEELAIEFQTTEISLTKLASRENISRWIITERFKELGVLIINKQNKTKFDETVFDSIDSEEKSYWLGFLMADGYLSSQDKNGKSKYTIELSLKGSDIEHLEKFSKFLKHTSPNIKVSNIKCGNSISTRCRFSITNKHLWEKLNSYGCTPKKSLSLQFPRIDLFKDKSLIRHFLRGYFDGDGCFSRYVYKTVVTPHILVLGTPEFLNKWDIVCGISSNIIHDKRHTDRTEIRDYSKEEGISFINLIYNNATIYLNRKYKMYEFFKNGSRSVLEYTESLSGNIGEKLELESRDLMYENPEINSEIKESESSYSVESETL